MGLFNDKTKAEQSNTSAALATRDDVVDGVPAFLQGDISPDETGLDEINQDEIGVPRLSLMQPVSDLVSEGKAKPGTFRLNLVDEYEADSLDVMIVTITKGRAYFEDKEIKCRSFDQVTSDRKLSSRVQDKCEGCPLTAWTEDEGGVTLPPKCAATYNLFLVDITDPESDSYGTPFWFTVSKGAIKPFKAQALSKIYVRKPRIAYAWKIRLSCSMEKGVKGNYYVPQWEILGFVSKTEFEAAREKYLPMAKAMSFQQTVYTEEAAGVANGNGDLPDDEDLPI